MAHSKGTRIGEFFQRPDKRQSELAGSSSIFEPDMMVGYSRPVGGDGTASPTSQADEALKAISDKLRIHIETSLDAVTVTNLDGRIIAANSRAAILYELATLREMIGKDSFQFIAPEYWRDAAECLLQAFETGDTIDVHYELLRKDGSHYPVGLKICVLRDKDHTPVGFLQIARAISHVNLAQPARGDYIHDFSHDLNRSLKSIRAWAEVVRDDEPRDDQAARFLSRILIDSKETINKIEQVSDGVSIMNHLQLCLAPCDLIMLVARVTEALHKAAQKKSVSLESEIVNKPYLIVGDGSRLYHAIFGLLDSAIQSAPDETSISVVLAFEDAGVKLWIGNNGKQSAESGASEVFEKQQHRDAVDLAELGLRLASIEAIVKAHDGKVTVRNIDGGNMEFIIFLPSSLAIQPVVDHIFLP